MLLKQTCLAEIFQPGPCLLRLVSKLHGASIARHSSLRRDSNHPLYSLSTYDVNFSASLRTQVAQCSCSPVAPSRSSMVPSPRTTTSWGEIADTRYKLQRFLGPPVSRCYCTCVFLSPFRPPRPALEAPERPCEALAPSPARPGYCVMMLTLQVS